MSNRINKTTAIPLEVLELLPWFVIGKLSEDDRAFFENALQSNPSLQKQLTLEQQMIKLVCADKSILKRRFIASPEERLKSVFNVIDSPELFVKTSRNDWEVISNKSEKLMDIFGSLIPNLGIGTQYAPIACASMLLSITILSFFTASLKTETSSFFLASVGSQLANNPPSIAADSKQTILLVGFKGTAAKLRKNDAFNNWEINIVSPPGDDGYFKIGFKQPINANEIKKVINTLLAQEETIWFAGEVY